MPVSTIDIFFVTGESSGDLHSAHLLHDIKKLNPGITVSAIGGSKLKQSGAEILFDYSEINFVGFIKVFSNLKFLRNKLNQVKKYIYRNNPKMVILCDFPGFNLRLAKSIRKNYKGKIVYYITPQVWAWNRGRIKSIRDCVDICLVVFPFEKDLYDKNNIRNYYIGHPLVNQVKFFLESYLPVKKSGFTISLMPGSRLDEIEKMLPPMNGISKILSSEYGFKVRLICSENVNPDIYREYYKDPNGEIIPAGHNSNLKAIADSDFIITKFGTSNLECGLLGIPFCAVYRTGFINYVIAKMLIKIKYVSLVNIIFNKEIVKEFIQDNFTVDNVIGEILKVKNETVYRNRLISEFKSLWNYFEVRFDKASELIIKELNK
jgi:lipid-A-disaccharide synthase